MINIEPINIPTAGTATKLILKCLTLDMTATTASFYYELTTDLDQSMNYKTLLNGNLTMTESEYSQWGADNSYCINWACNKLGLTLSNN